MKSLFCLCLLMLAVSSATLSQNQTTNLEKYWNYRNRLREKYVVISQNVEHYGVNIPASMRDLDNGVVEWGDGNSGMSHYLSVLATELWLLKSNDQDYSETLKELYYAMLAMERMDLYSEYSLRYKENIGYYIQGVWIRGYVDPINDRNGFHIRDDVSNAFWIANKSHFGLNDFFSVFEGDPAIPSSSMEEISQDNIYHNLEGLALVAKLVGVESVANIPVTFVNSYTPNYLASKQIQIGPNVDFSLWAKDFVKRYVNYFQNTGTMTIRLFNGDEFQTHWVLFNPVTGQLVREGSGSDGDPALFYNIGFIAAGDKITGESLRVHDPGLVDLNTATNTFHTLFTTGPQAPFLFDDYKVRTLGMNGDIEGQNTLNILRLNRDRGSEFLYEHMPLYYVILHDENRTKMPPASVNYDSDKQLIESILNLAPVAGPTSNGAYAWSSDSRLVWPEKQGEQAARNLEYSGLDYMLLHNLHYIANRKEDFIKITIPATPVLLNNFFGNGVFRYGTIIAQNHIPTTGNASYYASKGITLADGFSAPEGSTFLAKVEPRANNYHGNLYVQPGSMGGRISKSSEPMDTDKLNEVYSATPYSAPQPQFVSKVNEILSVTTGKPLVTINPNPADKYLTVTLNEKTQETVRIVFLELNGRVLDQTELGDGELRFNTATLPDGLYLVQVYGNGKVSSSKFMVRH